jgi:hypothetical protein
MAYTKPPPEVTQLQQLRSCDAVVGLAVGPRQLLRPAKATFRYHLTLTAETPMVVFSRRPL